LAGGYLGARLQPLLSERGLRIVLGVLAAGLALTYAVQRVRARECTPTKRAEHPEATAVLFTLC